ncbi:hypothetical protein CDEST_05224 [Colletotrichum destructivum]|uniref:Rhodopsin domain-containing protein n=1 Tax=Colletotrichum destructivum TaxID=34406 RepID=A0AAX4IA60_9PEZI|nr:hypothetical protein CDEST_05224 [Colletotrichum destructivum]
MRDYLLRSQHQLKLSILFLYLRLSTEKRFRQIVYSLASIVVCYSIVHVFIDIFGCRPTRASWDLAVPKSKKACVDKLTTYMVPSIASIVMDVFILLLPLLIILLFATGGL